MIREFVVINSLMIIYDHIFVLSLAVSFQGWAALFTVWAHHDQDICKVFHHKSINPIYSMRLLSIINSEFFAMYVKIYCVF